MTIITNCDMFTKFYSVLNLEINIGKLRLKHFRPCFNPSTNKITQIRADLITEIILIGKALFLTIS